MLARFVLGAVTAGAVIAPELAGQMMNADEARRFVAGKVFAFTCFDGTPRRRRVLRMAARRARYNFPAPVRCATCASRQYAQVRGQSVCAGIAFRSSRASTSTSKTSATSAIGLGMGFAYCDFRRQGAAQMLLARAVARPRSLRSPVRTGSVEVSARRE